MKPGDLRRFRDGHLGKAYAGRTFMVLCVNESTTRRGSSRAVDILLDGRVETDLGYSWVEDSSEVISEAG